MQEEKFPFVRILGLFPIKDRPRINALHQAIYKGRNHNLAPAEIEFQFGAGLVSISPRAPRFFQQRIGLSGVYHIEEAAQEEHPDALHALARIHINGQFGPPDLRTAMEFCNKACELGSEPAKLTLAFLRVEIDRKHSRRPGELLH